MLPSCVTKKTAAVHDDRGRSEIPTRSCNIGVRRKGSSCVVSGRGICQIGVDERVEVGGVPRLRGSRLPLRARSSLGLRRGTSKFFKLPAPRGSTLRQRQLMHVDFPTSDLCSAAAVPSP